jgi:hypothetical protein
MSELCKLGEYKYVTVIFPSTDIIYNIPPSWQDTFHKKNEFQILWFECEN